MYSVHYWEHYKNCRDPCRFSLIFQIRNMLQHYIILYLIWIYCTVTTISACSMRYIFIWFDLSKMFETEAVLTDISEHLTDSLSCSRLYRTWRHLVWTGRMDTGTTGCVHPLREEGKLDSFWSYWRQPVDTIVKQWFPVDRSTDTRSGSFILLASRFLEFCCSIFWQNFSRVTDVYINGSLTC